MFALILNYFRAMPIFMPKVYKGKSKSDFVHYIEHLRSFPVLTDEIAWVFILTDFFLMAYK